MKTVVKAITNTVKISTLLISFLFFNDTLSQDIYDLNSDGKTDNPPTCYLNVDLNGDGIIGNDFIKFGAPQNSAFSQPALLSFIPFWSSPAGSFGNCWDGAVGDFDGDSLLDIAGYTFSPSKFYIWEQTSAKPDSFAIVFEYTKTEGSGFGPMTFGDTDNDGKTEIIVADFATFTRIYVFENSGDNLYESKNTQSALVHTNDGEQGRYLYIGDLNKNGKKEIICGRGDTGGGMIRIWEHNGTSGSHTYVNIYTYTTPTYIFSQGGIGDSDNDGYDEIFLTYGGIPAFTTYIRRIEYDSSASSFIHLQFQANSIGMPASYRVADINDDGIKELIATANSNSRATLFIYKNTGSNSYQYIDSVFETADNNNMLSQDIKILQGETIPSLLTGSFNGNVYVYQYCGGNLLKQFQKTDYPGPAIRRVYWTSVIGTDAYFNTWSSSSSNGAFYILKRDIQTGITNNKESTPEFSILRNYPNPFNPVTNIEFNLKSGGLVNLVIYDVLGKELVSLINGYMQPGKHKIKWNAELYAAGIYFYRINIVIPGNFTKMYSDTKSMVLIK